MFKPHYALIIMSFLLGGCAHHHAKDSQLPVKAAQHVVNQQRSMASFNQIDAEGRINLHLHTGYKKPRVILTGDARDLAQVQTTVDNDTLHISLGEGYPHYGAVDVDVQGRFLNELHYQGAGLITGNRLNTRYLDLYLANEGTTRLNGSLGIQKLVVNGNGLVQLSGVQSPYLQVTITGSPKVQMVGQANLAKLDIDSNASFSLYWLKSDKLTVRAKNAAKIQLAGVVNRLDVELWNKAVFKGRYLRTKRSFVKTHQHATAEISALNHQSSLATDASNIYYYNIPGTRADFMAFNGAVLNMREWSMDDTQDYTRYNKQFP